MGRIIVLILSWIIYKLLPSLAKEENIVNDITKFCSKGVEETKFLTNGMGIVDTLTVVVAENAENIDCTIYFTTEEISPDMIPLKIILIVNFPDVTKGEETNLCLDKGSELKVINTNEKDNVDICKTLLSKETYRRTNQSQHVFISTTHRVGVRIQFKKLFTTLEFIATTASPVDSKGSCGMQKVLCFVRSTRLCLNEQMRCNSRIQCEETDKMDYNFCNKGNEVRSLWLIVLFGAASFFIVVFFFINLLRNCIPKVSKNFFHFDDYHDNRLFVETIHKAPRIGSVAPHFGKGRSMTIKSKKSSTVIIKVKPTVSYFPTESLESTTNLSFLDPEKEVKSTTYADIEELN